MDLNFRVFPESICHARKLVTDATMMVFTAIVSFRMGINGVSFEGFCNFGWSPRMSTTKLNLRILEEFWSLLVLFRDLKPEADYMRDPIKHQEYVNTVVSCAVLGFYLCYPHKLAFGVDHGVDLNHLPMWLNRLMHTMYFDVNQDLKVVLTVKNVQEILTEKSKNAKSSEIRNERDNAAKRRLNLVKRGILPCMNVSEYVQKDGLEFLSPMNPVVPMN